MDALEKKLWVGTLDPKSSTCLTLPTAPAYVTSGYDMYGQIYQNVLTYFGGDQFDNFFQ